MTFSHYLSRTQILSLRQKAGMGCGAYSPPAQRASIAPYYLQSIGSKNDRLCPQPKAPDLYWSVVRHGHC